MAVLTRADAEISIISRLRGWMAQVGMDVTTVNGTNLDLADPLSATLRAINLSTADPITPVDSDFAQVPDGRIDEVLAIAQLFTMRSILGRFSSVDEWAGTDKQHWSDFGRRIQTGIDDLQDDLKNRFGFGLRQTRGPKLQKIAINKQWPPNPPPPLTV